MSIIFFSKIGAKYSSNINRIKKKLLHRLKYVICNIIPKIGFVNLIVIFIDFRD